MAGGNRFHRVPLILATKDGNGNPVSFMPGGPVIPLSRRKDVVLCVTLDGNNREIPIPFMGDDSGIVTNVSDLAPTPPDGLFAMVRKGRLTTTGSAPTISEVVYQELFFAYDLPLENITGAAMFTFSGKIGSQTVNDAIIIMLIDAEEMECGLSGPIMILTNGDTDTEAATKVWINTPEAGIWDFEGFPAIDVDAGWNLLAKTNGVWHQSRLEGEDIPLITNAVITEGESDAAFPSVSTAEWVWEPMVMFSLGGDWHSLELPLPKFLASFPEDDNAGGHLTAHTGNMYSLARLNNGECQAPTFSDNCKILSGYLNVSKHIRINIPTATLHTTEAVKTALELSLSNLLTTAFGVGSPTITINEFQFFDEQGSPSTQGTWDGRVIWHSQQTEEVVAEPYIHYNVNVYFRD